MITGDYKGQFGQKSGQFGGENGQFAFFTAQIATTPPIWGGTFL